MMFKDIQVRPIREGDREQLDLWRRSYWEGDLELPFGFVRPGVETTVAEKKGEMIASLTGKFAIVLDPLIKNPATPGLDMVSAIFMMERTLSFLAQQAGAVESYIAIPEQLTEYHKIVEKAGYVETVQNCKVFRRALVPETVPLLGDERDALQPKEVELK